MPKITRRQAALGAFAASSLAAQDAAKPYTGALDGFESKVRGESFDPVAWTLERYKLAPMKLAFRDGGRTQTEAWQKKLRTKVAELLDRYDLSLTAALPLKPRWSLSLTAGAERLVRDAARPPAVESVSR